MNIDELIQKCLIDKDAIVTYPFKDDKYGEIPVLRHKSNNKWFGLIFEKDGELCINLKAKPIDIAILKDEYPNSIKPAWHMNKTHWCMVLVNKIDKKLLDNIIKISFKITAKKFKNKL